MTATHLEIPNWLAIGAVLFGSGFIGTTLVWLGRNGWRATRAVAKSYQQLQALVHSVEDVGKNVAWMTKELRPNGGSSLADSVRRTEQMVAFERIARRASSVNVALYERDRYGEPMYVSPAFSALTGLSVEDCRDAGWSRIIATDERARALQAFATATEGGTFYADEFTITHPQSGERTRIKVEEVPVTFHDDIIGWLGRWVPVAAKE